MMNIADPTYLAHLRDLPSSYLLDLLADNEDIDEESIYWVLHDRGMSREEINTQLRRRRSSRWPRTYSCWQAARWLTLFNTLVVTYFNATGLYQLMHSDHPFRIPLLFLAVGCILFGLTIGLKLTTHLYQGSKSVLYCGFPFPVGFVELETGEEILKDKRLMTLRMALNALVGVSLTLFPLIFLFIMLD